MDQLVFKFPFSTTYFEKDFYVSSNNFEAYKLLENWPNWPGKKINVFGPHGCGKTHLANILNKKINSIFVRADKLKENTLKDLDQKDCLIIEDYQNNIDEKFFYTILNIFNQTNKYIVINSVKPINKFDIKLIDLKSRLDNFINLGIKLPSDDLLRVIITKYFSDKQIRINVKILEYILKNIERSYEKVFKFIKDVDILSLSTGKSININLIKKVLKK